MPPIIRDLPDDFSVVEAFKRLHHLPGCLWLDSSSSGPNDASSIGQVGRYSFLTADPVDTIRASFDEPNPWPKLDRWCRDLPADWSPDFPPFQGGIAGLIGYEAGAWLEPVGVAAENDFPTPAISLGLYDWVIAVDHQERRAQMISQGFAPKAAESRSPEFAQDRIRQIESLLADPTPPKNSQSHTPVDSPVTSNLSGEQFRDRVSDVVTRIRNGDSFQVNLAQRLLRAADRPASELYLQLRQTNPAPFSAFYRDQDCVVMSSSPEGFLKVRDGVVETRPIKGTTGRTGDPLEDARLADLLFASEKDRAENIMIVDLMRNDLSRVCQDGSVTVDQLCQVERYQFVQHLVSVVRGRLRPEQTISDLLQACFPGGSVTGAPKIEAMRTITQLEPHHRGPYCGSIGYISCSGAADFNILIRTITESNGTWQIPVGGGITARSEPHAEEAETWAKAEGMLRAMKTPSAETEARQSD